MQPAERKYRSMLDGSSAKYHQARYLGPDIHQCASILLVIVRQRTFRSGQGFQPAYNVWRKSTVQWNRPGWMYMLRRLDGPSVRGHVTDAVTGQPLEARVLIDEIPLTAEEVPRTSEPLFGRYQRILLPGQYHLRVQADGYQEQVIPVTVGSAALDV